MKLAKLFGLVCLAAGLLLIVVPAVLPTTIVREGPGVLEYSARNDGCGSAAYAALRHASKECGRKARDRLAWTTASGLVLVVVGVFLASGDNAGQRSRLSSHQ
jgi:hypothetical protein